MLSTVIGGAMLPHAPQFFTMPDTEDKKLVAHVREVAADIGKRLRALDPDLWIIFSNDHAEQFFHTTAPPFTVHVGGEATGEFAGRKFHWRIPSEIEKLAAGHLKSLIGFDEAELDDTGNIELRCWACAAGALGERKPDVVSMDPSWHHNYASLAWIGAGSEERHAAHYPSIRPE